MSEPRLPRPPLCSVTATLLCLLVLVAGIPGAAAREVGPHDAVADPVEDLAPSPGDEQAFRIDHCFRSRDHSGEAVGAGLAVAREAGGEVPWVVVDPDASEDGPRLETGAIYVGTLRVVDAGHEFAWSKYPASALSTRCLSAWGGVTWGWCSGSQTVGTLGTDVTVSVGVPCPE